MGPNIPVIPDLAREPSQLSSKPVTRFFEARHILVEKGLVAMYFYRVIIVRKHSL
jgi:hypothetical protein